MPTINLYTWHKSKESVFLQVQQEKTESLEPSHQGFLEKKSGDLISWYGLGQDCWSLVIQFAYESNSISWSNVEISNRNSTFSFPRKKRASQILPHDAGFGWPQFQKTTWDCDTTLMLSICGHLVYQPTSAVVTCLLALQHLAKTHLRCLAVYLGISTAQVPSFKKNSALPMDRDPKEKVTMLDHDHQHDDGFQCSTTVCFLERCKSSISDFSFLEHGMRFFKEWCQQQASSFGRVVSKTFLP